MVVSFHGLAHRYLGDEFYIVWDFCCWLYMRRADVACAASLEANIFLVILWMVVEKSTITERARGGERERVA